MTISTRTATAVLAACATAAFGIASAPTASAGPQDAQGKTRWSRTINAAVGMPFSLAVAGSHVYYTDGATSTVNRMSGGKSVVIARGPQPGDVAGLDVTKDSRSFAYTTTDYATGAATLTIATKGKPDVVADLSGYEQRVNPDGWQTYGIIRNESADPQCARDALAQLSGLPATYKGIKESHPYAVAVLGDGAWAVADAGGNSILRVDRMGSVSTLAVLPRQPLTLTPAMVAAVGAPACVAGVTYAFEPVPTDVEVDKDGMLWVSTLPGGPESPGLGKRGSVYKVNPWKHTSTRVATGFAGATNLAVGDYGGVFVTELFGGRVSKLWQGAVLTVAKVDQPLAVEARGKELYVGTMASMDQNGNVTRPGSILRYRIGG